jgi:hypothetical protein
MNPLKKAALIAVAIPVYLIASLYLSVGIGDVTRNPGNTAFAALVLLVIGVAALVKVAGRRRGGVRA